MRGLSASETVSGWHHSGALELILLLLILLRENQRRSGIEPAKILRFTALTGL